MVDLGLVAMRPIKFGTHSPMYGDLTDFTIKKHQDIRMSSMNNGYGSKNGGYH